MTFLTKPDKDGNKRQKTEIISGQLIKASKDTPEPLDLVEEALDEMPLLIKMPVIVSGLLAVFARRDNRDSTHLSDGGEQVSRIVCFVGNDIVALVSGKEFICLLTLVRLPWSQDEVQRVPQSIHNGVDLGGESTATSA